MRIRSKFLTRLAARISIFVLRILFWTCRKDVRTEVDGTNVYEDTGDERFLVCVWHDQIVMTVFTGRPQKVAGLVSPHQDGSYLAEAMKMLGIATVRGSTNRGAARALRESRSSLRTQRGSSCAKRLGGSAKYTPPQKSIGSWTS